MCVCFWVFHGIYGKFTFVASWVSLWFVFICITLQVHGVICIQDKKVKTLVEEVMKKLTIERPHFRRYTVVH